MVDPVQDNESYKRHHDKLTQPLFLVGDSITGKCKILCRPNEKLKHKGILVRLIGRYSAGESLLQEFTVLEQRISPGAIIESDYVAGFTFDKPRISYPSYHGVKYSLTYHIIVEVKVSVFTKLIKQESIAFLDPIRVLAPPTPTKIHVMHPPTCFDIVIDKSIYAMDECINGQIVFGKHKQTGLQTVSLGIVLTERFRDGSQTRSEDITMCKYELVDGCPRPNISIPFVIQLSPLKLWTTKNNHQSVISTNFKIVVFVKRNDQMQQMGEHVIQIYQRFVEKHIV